MFYNCVEYYRYTPENFITHMLLTVALVVTVVINYRCKEGGQNTFIHETAASFHSLSAIPNYDGSRKKSQARIPGTLRCKPIRYSH